MGIIDDMRKRGANPKELSSCCPFCGSTCAMIFTAPFGTWHVICDDAECGADFMFFMKETDRFKTAKAFSRRDGVEKMVKTVMKEYFRKEVNTDGNLTEDHGDL